MIIKKLSLRDTQGHVADWPMTKNGVVIFVRDRDLLPELKALGWALKISAFGQLI